MTDLGQAQFTERINSWRRLLAGSTDTEQAMELFRQTVVDVAKLLSRGLQAGPAVDQLLEMAEAYGLCTDGQEQIEQIIHEAFARVPRPKPKPNGGGDGHEIEPLCTFTAAKFRGTSAPTRRWLIENWVPMRNVTLLGGAGATGKTIIALQLCVVIATGFSDWLGGIMSESGNVLFVTAEEEEEEIHRRLEKIVTHYDLDYPDNLHIHCLDENSFLVVPKDRYGGGLVKTKEFVQLELCIVEIKPKLIVLESAADLYGSDQRNTTHVRQFIFLLRQIARKHDCTIVLLYHPSVRGMADQSGTSGSVAWNNSVRSRIFFRVVKNGNGKDKDDEDEPDEGESDLRQLTIMKANYSKQGEKIRLMWSDGVFVHEKKPSQYELVANDQHADHVFISLLRRFYNEGRNVSHVSGTTYAPAIFAREQEAKLAKLDKRDLSSAMRRLFTANKIKVMTDGPPSRMRSKIVEVTA